LFPPSEPVVNIFSGSYRGYYGLAQSGLEEPMTTHSDHYETNRAYGSAAYSKGAVTLGQLSYIMGHELFMKAMRRYFNTWKFKHPNANDFKRIMEKESGLELDWYFEHWVGTTNTIDYGIGNVMPKGGGTMVNFHRHGNMMMPLEVAVTTNDGNTEMFYIPLRIMRGEKAAENEMKRTTLEDWPWTYEQYTAMIPIKMENIESIVIDPSGRLADVDPSNNFIEFKEPDVIFMPKK